MEVKRGDIVQLKSGGPEMTIKGIIDNTNYPVNNSEAYDYKLSGLQKGDIICQWFGQNGELRTEGFNPDMLKAPPKYNTGITTF